MVIMMIVKWRSCSRLNLSNGWGVVLVSWSLVRDCCVACTWGPLSPPCPLVPHYPADFTPLSFSPNLMAIMLKIIMIMIMITLCLGHQQCFLILRQTFSCVGIVSFPNPLTIDSIVKLSRRRMLLRPHLNRGWLSNWVVGYFDSCIVVG